jgi:hypothetical protein
MIDWFLQADTFTHTIAALLLLGRLGDIISTRLVTPTLRLEANPLARRLGWRFAWLSLLLALLPYYSNALGIAALPASLLVSASNLSRGWAFRALGEAGAEAFLLGVAERSRLGTALGFFLSGASFVVVAGVVLMWLSGWSEAATYWFGFGIVIYGVAIALHGTVFIVKLFRRVRVSARAV